ncbi:MAG: hypothetical protein A2289_21820 [Deltaproteobacteria bacterium RIFOXYA12_FULL_58_15]|nr:MAG: hypothetical protein A2289_21820 [Deltaproteobacteria bacterium RIFOXYA12_FULL_58_15]OGR11617.1 MAG: hypothetical protein A2341_02670 [Deltaproteobacteria bacterium RIFOXYB12_FULL_58_9]
MPDDLILTVPPIWEEIEGVREAVRAHLQRQGIGDGSVDALSMVATELMENANKYGAFGVGDKITMTLEQGSAAITVGVRHAIGAADDSNLVRLDRTVQWIRGFQDPFEAYVARLEEVSAQSLYSEESGLGLVRIAYEGRAILDFCLEADGTVTVSAVYPL